MILVKVIEDEVGLMKALSELAPTVVYVCSFELTKTVPDMVERCSKAGLTVGVQNHLCTIGDKFKIQDALFVLSLMIPNIEPKID